MKALFRMAQLQKFADHFVDEKEEKMVQMLVFAGESGVKMAKESGNYTDRTGNLRSSIGYMVLKDGAVIKEFFRLQAGTDGQDGLNKGRKLALQVGQNLSGYVLVLVAGMNYAYAVEALKNYDVLQSGVYASESTLKSIMNGILSYGT